MFFLNVPSPLQGTSAYITSNSIMLLSLSVKYGYFEASKFVINIYGTQALFVTLCINICVLFKSTSLATTIPLIPTFSNN